MDINEIDRIKNTPTFTMNIIQFIEKNIKREITNSEENSIITYVKELPNKLFLEYSANQIKQMIINNVLEDMFNKHCDANVVNTHELLKKTIASDDHTHTFKEKKEIENSVNINLASAFGIDEISDLVKKVNEPVSSINNAFLLLDTRYRELGNDGTEYFTWGHINSLVRAQGTINSIGNIRDIISVTVFNYRMPAVSSAITPYGRISISIDELIPQSYIAHEKKRFHFICRIDHQVGNWLEICADDVSNGIYKFNKSITHLDSITIRFGSPLEPIIFDKDRLPGMITYANPTVINFSEDHNLTNGDIVYLDNFTTINPQYDSVIINEINSTTGNVATVLSPTSIHISVDTSNIITTLTGTVTVPSITLAGNVTVSINTKIVTGIGTTFVIDFDVGDYIQIQNGVNNPIFIIQSIENNTELTLKTNYKEASGTYTYRKTGLNIVGVGTSFITELDIGDNLIISDGGTSPSFIIKSIQDNLNLILETPYNGMNGAGFAINKDNSLTNDWSVYFGSKRIFIPLELTYLSS